MKRVAPDGKKGDDATSKHARGDTFMLSPESSLPLNQASPLSVEGDDTLWKQPLAFLQHYGYSLSTLQKDTRISLLHDNSMDTKGGRSAPRAENLIAYLKSHPTARVAYNSQKKEELIEGYWCKHCGWITESTTPHQNNCLYRKHEYNSATYPKEVYAFLDAAPDMADNYEEGDMAEWYSLFGHYGSLLDAPILPDVFEEKEEEAEEAVDDVEPPIQELIRFWVRICSDKENRIDASGVRAVRECLDMFLERVLELANEESLRRTCNEPNRVLVPSLVEGIIPKCSYLEFISNSGLLKP
ncbi:hypothetical protein WA577_004697, partial [Blastocystis sp. JDR]